MRVLLGNLGSCITIRTIGTTGARLCRWGAGVVADSTRDRVAQGPAQGTRAVLALGWRRGRTMILVIGNCDSFTYNLVSIKELARRWRSSATMRSAATRSSPEVTGGDLPVPATPIRQACRPGYPPARRRRRFLASASVTSRRQACGATVSRAKTQMHGRPRRSVTTGAASSPVSATLRRRAIARSRSSATRYTTAAHVTAWAETADHGPHHRRASRGASNSIESIPAIEGRRNFISGE